MVLVHGHNKQESELQELVMMRPPRFIDQEIKYKLVPAAAACSCHCGFVWRGRGALPWDIYGVSGPVTSQTFGSQSQGI